MKKFLIAGSSLAAVAAAGSAGAVDVTLGGSIDMGVEFGLGKNAGNFGFSDAYSKVGLSLAAAGTTDGGMKYGGSFSISTITEIELGLYEGNGVKNLLKFTQDEASDIVGQAWNISGGDKVTKDRIVSVKINSAWMGVGGTLTGYAVEVTKGITADDICKIAGKVQADDGGGSLGISRSGVQVFRDRNYNQPDGYLAAGVLTIAGDADGNDPLMIEGATITGRSGYIQVKGLEKSDGNKVTVGAKPTKWGRLDNVWSTGHSAKVSQGGGPVSAITKLVVKSTNLDKQGAASAAAVSGDSELVFVNPDPTPTTTTIAEPLVNDDRVVQNSDLFNFALGTEDGDKTTGKAVVTGASGLAAKVYAGPFMEVKLASSTTKMVVGAVCLTRDGDYSESAIFIDNKSNILGASGAKIFVEGGFGKLTVQTSDYTGTVSAIGDAGNAAKIGADGLVVIAEGIGLFGANPYLAVDLSGQISSLEVMTGGTIDLGGLSLGVDAKISTDGIGAWDLGGTYSMGDMDLGFAYDSSNDWGLSSSMALAGFAVDAEFYSKTGGDHEKSGIYYNVSASTSMNGMGLEIGFDQDLKPEIGVSYDVGNMNIYAGYDAADEGGKVGAKLSF